MTIKALSRALEVLRHFDGWRPEWSVSELVRETALSKSHVHKILKEFVAADFLVQDSNSRRYRPGPRSFLLGSSFSAGAELVRTAEPFVQELATSVGAISGFSIPCRTQSLFVLMASGAPNLRTSFPPGSLTPLHATSAGKLRAAFLPDSEQREILRQSSLRVITARTIVRRSVLEQQLQHAKETGIAFTFGESTISLAGVSAAVVDDANSYAGAVTLLLPYRQDCDVINRRILSHVKYTATRIAHAIGATSYPFPKH